MKQKLMGLALCLTLFAAIFAVFACAEDHVCNPDRSTGICECGKTYEASVSVNVGGSITEIFGETLEKAFAEAHSYAAGGGNVTPTVTLLRDCEVGSTIKITSPMNINLNDRKITVSSDYSEKTVFDINADTVITDGTARTGEINSGDSYSLIINSGNVRLYGGKYRKIRIKDSGKTLADIIPAGYGIYTRFWYYDSDYNNTMISETFSVGPLPFVADETGTDAVGNVYYIGSPKKIYARIHTLGENFDISKLKIYCNIGSEFISDRDKFTVTEISSEWAHSYEIALELECFDEYDIGGIRKCYIKFDLTYDENYSCYSPDAELDVRKCAHDGTFTESGGKATCDTCGIEMTVKITYDDKTLYTDSPAKVNVILPSGLESDVYIKLLKEPVGDYYGFPCKKNYTWDLGGFTIKTKQNLFGSNNDKVIVKNGTIESVGNSLQPPVWVTSYYMTDEAVGLELENVTVIGHAEDGKQGAAVGANNKNVKLTNCVFYGSVDLKKGAKVYGCTFHTAYGTNEPTHSLGAEKVKSLADLLPDGYAFRAADGKIYSGENHSVFNEDVTVVPHTHTMEDGKCTGCDKYYRSVLMSGGTKEYSDDIIALIAKAQESTDENCTVKLLGNITYFDGEYENIVIDKGNFTLDLGDSRLRFEGAEPVITIGAGSLTITADGEKGGIYSKNATVIRCSDYYGATGFLNIKNGTFHCDSQYISSAVLDGAHSKIEGGYYSELYFARVKALAVLEKGYALKTDDGTWIDYNANEYSYKNVHVTAAPFAIEKALPIRTTWVTYGSLGETFSVSIKKAGGSDTVSYKWYIGGKEAYTDFRTASYDADGNLTIFYDGDEPDADFNSSIYIVIKAELDGEYTATFTSSYIVISKRYIYFDVSCADKVYDGSTDAEVSLTFGNRAGEVALVKDVDYTVSANFEDADAGEDKTVTVTVTLIGKAAGNYNLNRNTEETKASIKKIEPSIDWKNYLDAVYFDNKELKDPADGDISFVGASVSDIASVKWYNAENNGGVYTKTGSPLTSNPINAGDYYVEIAIDETKNTYAKTFGGGKTIKKSKSADFSYDVYVFAHEEKVYPINLYDIIKDSNLGGTPTFGFNGSSGGMYASIKDNIVNVRIPLLDFGTEGEIGIFNLVAHDALNTEQINIVLHVIAKPKSEKTLDVAMDDFVYGGTGAPKYTAPSGTKDVKVTYKGIGSTSYAESEEVPTAAGTYKVTVVCETEDSMYSGSADFEITKKPITGAVVTLGESLTYNGSEQTQTVIKVTLDGKDITAFCDVSENTAKNAGRHTLKVTAKGDSNYTSSETAEFTVAKLEISFTATVQDKTYDAGSSATAALTFDKAVANAELKNGRDYSVSAEFADKNVGTHIVKVKAELLDTEAAGNYLLARGEDSSNKAAITPRDISELTDITVTGTDAEYSGQPQSVNVTAIYGGETLVNETDYTVSYKRGGSTVSPVSAGTYEVTVVGKGNFGGEKTVGILTINPRTVKAKLEGTNTKVYDGTKKAPSGITVSLNGVIGDDDVFIRQNYSISYNDENVEKANTIKTSSLTLAGADAGNYKPESDYASMAGTITPKAACASVTVDGSPIYNGSEQRPAVKAYDGNILIPESEYEVIYTDNVNAGTAKVTLKDRDGGNYTVTGSGTFKIEKTYFVGRKDDGELVVSNDYAKTYSFDFATLVPDASPLSFGKVTFALFDIFIEPEYYNGGATVSQDGKLTLPILRFDSREEKRIGYVTVTVISENFENIGVSIDIKTTNKTLPTAEPMTDISSITYGDEIGKIKLSGIAKDGNTVVDGTFSWKEPNVKPNAGTFDAPFVFTPENDEVYYSVTGTVKITVNKATPTGTPSYDLIKSYGKTLADTNLSADGRFSVVGSAVWTDKDGNALPSNESVKANTEYRWLFTPNDTQNYNTVAGTVILFTKKNDSGKYVPNPIRIGNGSSEGGRISVPSGGISGSVIRIKVTPDDGYTVGDVTVRDASGNKIGTRKVGDGEYAFTMPMSSVTVDCTFVRKAPEKSAFDDVPNGAFFTDAVNWAVGNGITTGTSDTEFSPYKSCTRAQAVTFIWRFFGSPEPSGTDMPFDDVGESDFCYKAVLWAIENGVTSGKSSTKFDPMGTCTRAQIVTFLYRAMKVSSSEVTKTFDDVDTDAYYAAAVSWAVENGITSGVGENRFAPDKDCTRAHTVTFIYRASLLK